MPKVVNRCVTEYEQQIEIIAEEVEKEVNERFPEPRMKDKRIRQRWYNNWNKMFHRRMKERTKEAGLRNF